MVATCVYELVVDSPSANKFEEVYPNVPISTTVGNLDKFA